MRSQISHFASTVFSLSLLEFSEIMKALLRVIGYEIKEPDLSSLSTSVTHPRRNHICRIFHLSALVCVIDLRLSGNNLSCALQQGPECNYADRHAHTLIADQKMHFLVASLCLSELSFDMEGAEFTFHGNKSGY